MIDGAEHVPLDELRESGGSCLVALNHALAMLDSKKIQADQAMKFQPPSRVGEDSTALSPEEKMRENIMAAQEALLALGITEVAAPAVGRAESLLPRSASQQAKGTWAVTQTHGPIPDDLLTRGKQIDKSLCTSISTAVNGLNQGILNCPEGFCSVWSSSRQGYFVLYDDLHKAECFRRFGPK